MYDQSAPDYFRANPIFEFLNGKPYVLDGISGHFVHEIRSATYPCPHRVERLYHDKDAPGQETERYQAVKYQLGDDWCTDLTESIETYCDIALEMGYHEEGGQTV